MTATQAKPLNARAKALLDEIERVSAILGRKPRYVTNLCGQGGVLVDRILSGGRVWPETEDAVRAKLAQLEKDHEAKQAAKAESAAKAA